MPRILYWNIENFAIGKLTQLFVKRQFGGRPRRANDAKGQYILDTLNATDQAGALLDPDFVVVVEVSTGRAPGGSLVTGAGAEGALLLLDHLQNTPARYWHLVPPLVLGAGGNAEGIAVYYRSDRWRFTGPWYWNGATAQALAAGARAYDGDWADALPAGSNTRAGQPSFMTAPAAPPGGGPVPPPQPIYFPNANNRPPFLTQFTEIAAPNRILNLFGFHAPATFLLSMQATVTLATIPQVAAPLAANEIRIIAGDFNTNLNSTTRVGNAGGVAAGLSPANAFNRLTGLGYVQHFVAADGGTMLKSVGFKYTSNNIANTNGAFPEYGYLRNLAVDNILTRANPALAVQRCIVNRVIGTPTNAAYTTLANRPAGNRYSVAMEETIQDIIAGTAPGAARLRRFNAVANFGRMGGKRGASDHMALMVEF